MASFQPSASCNGDDFARDLSLSSACVVSVPSDLTSDLTAPCATPLQPRTRPWVKSRADVE